MRWEYGKWYSDFLFCPLSKNGVHSVLVAACSSLELSGHLHSTRQQTNAHASPDSQASGRAPASRSLSLIQDNVSHSHGHVCHALSRCCPSETSHVSRYTKFAARTLDLWKVLAYPITLQICHPRRRRKLSNRRPNHPRLHLPHPVPMTAARTNVSAATTTTPPSDHGSAAMLVNVSNTLIAWTGRSLPTSWRITICASSVSRTSMWSYWTLLHEVRGFGKRG